jgi:Winged helix DNA-binding domain
MTANTVRRLLAQRLIGEPFASPIEVVRWLCAVQAQDFNGAKWALAQRSRPTTDVELDRLFDEGAILRTHVLRPTWHFVLPEDIHWLLELTAPRVLLGMAGRHRDLEIDANLIARCEALFASALVGGHHRTRAELGQVLEAAGVFAKGQRLTELIMSAELHRVVTSGPRRGKAFTYALLEERAPSVRQTDRGAAILELARRYFQSHGPAQLQDFVWWSGMTTADARTGIADAAPALDRLVLDSKEYWFEATPAPPPLADGAAHLLSNFDEYTVAYRDRTDLYEKGSFDPTLFPRGSILSNVVAIGGRVCGVWRRSTSNGLLRVEIRLQDHIGAIDRDAVEEAAHKLARFLGKPLALTWA